MGSAVTLMGNDDIFVVKEKPELIAQAIREDYCSVAEDASGLISGDELTDLLGAVMRETIDELYEDDDDVDG